MLLNSLKDINDALRANASVSALIFEYLVLWPQVVVLLIVRQ